MDYTNEKYVCPSSVNVADFVTVRPQLTDEVNLRSRNFKLWREQMLCLLKSKDVVGFINGETKEPQSDEQKLWRRIDSLVKGWILGSIGVDVLQYVCVLETSREVWSELDNIFNFVFSTDVVFFDTSWPSSVNVAKFVTVRPQLNEEEEERSTNFNIWREQMLCLLESQDVVGFINGEMVKPQNNEQKLWRITNKLITGWILSSIGEDVLQMVLHLKTARDVWVKLEKILNPGRTALHEAASVGNTIAARAMVEKNPDLLYMMDDEDDMPIISAALYGQKETLEYMISVSKPNMENGPIELQHGIKMLNAIIFFEFIDVALDLVHKHLVQPSEGFVDALKIMAQTESVFESRQSFSWWEKFIYRCVPVKQSESRPSLAGDIEAPTCSSSFPIINGGKYQLSFSTTYILEYNCKVAGKRCKTMIWKVMEQLVPGVKDIKDKKKLHNQALELVKCLCHQMKSLPTIDAWTMLQDSMMCAAENGVSEIVEVIIEMYPALATSVDENGWTIMHMAVSGRFEFVFNFNYNMIDRKNKFYNYNNKGESLLELCARLPNPEKLNIVTGAALQMQRELQWFNEVERFVPPFDRLNKKEGKTAKMLFTEQHQKLKEEGERWLKDTANACSIATALIATVVFAASFTVPGGVSEETGMPIFFEEPAFILFATTNAVSLFTSITSLLLFLSILTSRFAEQDFLYVLPKRLSFGLLTLFISIIFMLLAFSAALYLLFRTKLVWFIIPVTTFGWLPVASFVRLQFPLLVDVVYSTYGPGIFRKRTRERFD